ncbi:acyltransferase family protein, partial [Prevotella sp. P3-122]|uniref:acyltransferase family protein n=1 Tax=Prevotella sp. P3-122 TaxID=2024223 RepID=UPI000BD782FE
MEIHKRLQYVDFLKGFAILCVVVGHIAAFNPKCDLLIDFVYSFHMPLFFFISGFLCHKK